MGSNTSTAFPDNAREKMILHGRIAGPVYGFERAATGIGAFGCVILLVGGLRVMRRVNHAQVAPGRSILAGLDLLIVSDIIRTVIRRATAGLVVLGLLVVIRSLISFVLHRELADVKRELSE